MGKLDYVTIEYLRDVVKYVKQKHCNFLSEQYVKLCSFFHDLFLVHR